MSVLTAFQPSASFDFHGAVLSPRAIEFYIDQSRIEGNSITLQQKDNGWVATLNQELTGNGKTPNSAMLDLRIALLLQERGLDKPTGQPPPRLFAALVPAPKHS